MEKILWNGLHMKHTQVNIPNLLNKFTFLDKPQENGLNSLGGLKVSASKFGIPWYNLKLLID